MVLRAILFSQIILTLSLNAQQVIPRNYAVELSAQTQLSPPQIMLKWLADARATNYSVYRRSSPADAWSSLGVLPGGATSYSDNTVSAGVPYEYQVIKGDNANPPFRGTGYIYAGINAPALLDRGKAILIVANNAAAALGAELAQFISDLVGDGWTVARHDVSVTDSVTSVKAVIKAENDAGRARALILFGHIPVPYSGNIYPDGHLNHQGAWPADVYYADLDGSWTDSSLTAITAEREINRNVPGDGKFDQSELPSDVELETGRIDLSSLTSFANKTPSRSEIDLLRQYLRKDHDWRHGRIVVPRRGLVLDLAGIKEGGPVADSGWRNFSPYFSTENVSELLNENFFSRVRNEGYLFSYAAGGGGYYLSDGVGSADDFATIDLKTVFLLMIGSYFGDWNNESNFERSALGSGSILASTYSGYPHSFFHHMALGETIGYGIRISQNNTTNGPYLPPHQGTRQVHISLMGDPTLRMHPVLPPSNVSVTRGSVGYNIAWSPSADSAIQGYHVFRAANPAGPFQKLTSRSPLSATSYQDTLGSPGSIYMVRALKLESSGSGTYLNPSEGIFSEPAPGSGGTTPQPPNAPSNLAAAALSSTEIQLSWSDQANNESGFRVERKGGGNANFTVIATVGPDTSAYKDSQLSADTAYQYRLLAFNDAGSSLYSSEAGAATKSAVQPGTPGSGKFIAGDTTTQGTWRNGYGKDGFLIPLLGGNLPAYATATVGGGTEFSWADPTSDTRALQKPGDSSQRGATCWYAADSLSANINAGSDSHRVAVYLLDWDGSGRQETVELADAVGGGVLDTRTVSSFRDGQFLVYEVKGAVAVRFKRVAGPNAVLSGIFFDPAGTGTVLTPPRLGTAGIRNSAIVFELQGTTGQRLILQTSPDLRSWSSVSTNQIQNGNILYEESIRRGEKSWFYRLLLAQ